MSSHPSGKELQRLFDDGVNITEHLLRRSAAQT